MKGNLASSAEMHSERTHEPWGTAAARPMAKQSNKDHSRATQLQKF